MQTTAEFASNSTANIKLSKRPSFFLLTSNKFITKIKNVADKKLCGGAVALKTNLRQLILQCCDFKNRISIELACSPGRFT